MTLLERYSNGEYKEVWAELVAGVDRLGRPIADQDAEAVADETMRRVRLNAETLVRRLTETGYEFSVYPDGVAMAYPPVVLGDRNDADKKIKHLTALIGTIPLSLSAFYRHVGSVCLAGRYPEEPEWDYPDPLWVEPADSDYINDTFVDWRADVEQYGEEEAGPFHLEFAPDDLHKSNTSGGPPYSIVVPCGSADAFVENEWHSTTFVDYLRVCFEWGGFPGFAREWDGEHWTPKNAMKRVPDQILTLRTGLLPI